MERLYSEAFSDGSLRLIALVSALLQTPSLLPDAMLIDEPELGMHPSAISLVAALIGGVSVRCKVIVATQSPLLVHHVEPEGIPVAERERGGTHVTTLESERLDGRS
ncbi:MAG: AAA family ATPase [Gemmatimonadota bacterium]|nr:AAA family ATPase [Gemmatimonadota bacterium]